MGSGGIRPGAGRPGGSGKGKHIFYITNGEKTEIQAFLVGLRAQVDNATVNQKTQAAASIGTMPTDQIFEQNRRDLQKLMLRGQIESIDRDGKKFVVTAI